MQPLSASYPMDDSHPPQPADRDLAAVPNASAYRVSLRGEVVTAELVKADTMWKRMRGLLGRGSLAPTEGLWIEPCNAIHMFFMRFPIDAVFLDEGFQVVRVHEDLRPWRMARGGKFAHSVLELPQGKAAFFNIRVGDKLQVDGVHR